MASHDDNHRYGKPGMSTMEKECPASYARMCDAFHDYAEYTSGEYHSAGSIEETDVICQGSMT